MNLRGPKGRIARRLGVAITPKCARILERRPNPPGQHGAAITRKVSNFKKQLIEKQRLRAQYNISERQLRNAFAEATRRPGNTGLELLRLLERRLDTLVLRAGFARTIFAARQLVSHGHVLVNGRRLSIPSARIAPGDAVSLSAKAVEIPQVVEARNASRPPAYVSVDEKGVIKLLEAPMIEQVPVICQLSLVVEFYSR